jgi:HSP20 family molecular chaperone IbpA
MTLNQFRESIDGLVRRYDYDDNVTFVADLGVADDAVSVDVVDGSAIVVIESGGTARQHEFELPDGDAQVFMKNGVLSIEVRQ